MAGGVTDPDPTQRTVAIAAGQVNTFFKVPFVPASTGEAYNLTQTNANEMQYTGEADITATMIATFTVQSNTAGVIGTWSLALGGEEVNPSVSLHFESANEPYQIVLNVPSVELEQDGLIDIRASADTACTLSHRDLALSVVNAW